MPFARLNYFSVLANKAQPYSIESDTAQILLSDYLTQANKELQSASLDVIISLMKADEAKRISALALTAFISTSKV